MNKLLAVAVMMLAIQGCTSKAPELKSPCVGTENSPCGPRINVNDWWLRQA